MNLLIQQALRATVKYTVPRLTHVGKFHPLPPWTKMGKVPLTLGSFRLCHHAVPMSSPNASTLKPGHAIHCSLARIQQPAPHFSANAVIDGQFKQITLDDYKGKYLILLFYPLDFTFVCPTEILAFDKMLDQFKAINCEVVAVSVDSEYTHLAFVNKPRTEGGLGFVDIPLLSDTARKMSREYGVLLEDRGIALRGMFIIDSKGILRQVTMNDLPVGRSVEEAFRLVQAFQFVDTHGEVCPAEWKPGKNSIIPDVEKSLEYFKKSARRFRKKIQDQVS